MKFSQSHTTQRVEQLVLALRDADQPPSLRVLGRSLGYTKDTVNKYRTIAEARGVIACQRGPRGQWLYVILEEAS